MGSDPSYRSNRERIQNLNSSYVFLAGLRDLSGDSFAFFVVDKFLPLM